MSSFSYFMGGLIIQAPTYALFVLGLLLVIGMIRKKFAYKSMLVCWLILFTVYGSPLPRYLVYSLEQKAREISPTELPADFEGFVFLGGVFSLSDTTMEMERPIYNFAATRLFDFILLAKAWPDKKILLTGTPEETAHTVKELARFGIDEKRLILEDQSRNTIDNANNSLKLVSGKGKWVLVTSAFHMLRSYVLFTQLGWDVIPYPVNFLTSKPFISWWPAPTNGLAWMAGSKEYIGLFHLGYY